MYLFKIRRAVSISPLYCLVPFFKNEFRNSTLLLSMNEMESTAKTIVRCSLVPTVIRAS